MAMGQGFFSLAQPLCLHFSVWRCCLLGHPIFCEGQGKTAFPREHPHCHWCTSSRHWRKLYPFRLRGGIVYHGISWTYFHLLRLRYDAEGSLRILACKSADLGRAASG